MCDKNEDTANTDEDEPKQLNESTSTKKSTQPQIGIYIPHFPNFLTEVLHSIQTLRTLNGHAPTLKEICTFMRLYYKADGDVESRVQTAILKAKADSFCTERKKRFMLLVPMACMQPTPAGRTRKALLREMQEIFLFKANMKKSESEIKQKDFGGVTDHPNNPTVNPISSDPWSNVPPSDIPSNLLLPDASARVMSKSEILKSLRDIQHSLKVYLQKNIPETFEITPSVASLTNLLSCKESHCEKASNVSKKSSTVLRKSSRVSRKSSKGSKERSENGTNCPKRDKLGSLDSVKKSSTASWVHNPSIVKRLG